MLPVLTESDPKVEIYENVHFNEILEAQRSKHQVLNKANFTRAQIFITQHVLCYGSLKVSDFEI
jgi:hypothetical protein